MRRNKIKKQFSLLITGDLTPKRTVDLENFVKGDRCLEEELGGLQKLIKNIAEIKADEPRQRFEQRIKRSVISSIKSESKRSLKKILIPAISSVAALILLSFFVFFQPDKKIRETEEWLAGNIDNLEALNGYSEINVESLAASELTHFDNQLQKLIDVELKEANQIVKETGAYLEWNTIFYGLLNENGKSISKKINQEL